MPDAATDCPHPESHSENGGPHRYCECGWTERTPAAEREPVDRLVSRLEEDKRLWKAAYAEGVAAQRQHIREWLQRLDYQNLVSMLDGGRDAS